MSNAFIETVNNLRKQGLNSDQILEKLEELSVIFQNLNINYDSIGKETEQVKIKNILNQLNMPAYLLGYQYWSDVIFLHRNNRNLPLMKLYQLVADQYNVNISQVDMALRYALKSSYEKCSEETLKSIFGKNVSRITKKPTNTQFLFIVTRLVD